MIGYDLRVVMLDLLDRAIGVLLIGIAAAVVVITIVDWFDDRRRTASTEDRV